jgi:hydroxyethylthiazole kinase-like uncharacterized protein yjeF
MKILTAVQMSEVDRLTTERYLIPSIILMENAGRSMADELEKACPGLENRRIVVCCGRGNNGGDGFVVARYIAIRGGHPEILLFADPEKLKGDAQINYEIVRSMELSIQILPDNSQARAYLKKIPTPDVIVDALFGTGLSKPIDADFRFVVDWINRASSDAFVAAVDIPSGLFADSPRIPGPAVRAHLTVTMTALKLALVVPPAADNAGTVVIVPIGSPPDLLGNQDYRMNFIDASQVRSVLPPRARDSHKGTFGHLYIVAGSRGKSGAALMTGLAALRSGVGLATLWLPKSLQRDVVGKFPELMTEFLPDTPLGTLDSEGARQILDQLPQAQALVVGPGVTTQPSTQKLIRELVRNSPVPVILDADGINAFARQPELLRNDMGQPVIITPHPGEMARFLGCKISEVQKDRLETARNCSVENGCFTVLKGFQTTIASPTGDVFINSTGNPGMATGGSGDILAGILGRFVAGWHRKYNGKNQRELADYISAAVFLHGLAGDLAAEEQGQESLIATDLLTHLPKAFKKVCGA